MDDDPCSMPARYMRFFYRVRTYVCVFYALLSSISETLTQIIFVVSDVPQALCIIAFVLLEAGALFAAHILFRDDPKAVVLMAGLYSGVPVCILIIGICCCNPKHVK